MEADALFLRSIGITEKALGPNHLQAAVVLGKRADMLQAQVIRFPVRRCLLFARTREVVSEQGPASQRPLLFSCKGGPDLLWDR